MRIGIDAHGVGGHSMGHGNETYFRQLVAALLKLDSDNEYHVFANHPEALADAIRGCDRARVVSLWPGSQWIQRPASLPLYAAAHRLDLIHVPFVIPPATSAKTVVTVHDLGFLEHPHLFRRLERLRMRHLVRFSCRRADMILTVSETSRRQIVRHYGISRDRIRVTSNAANHASPRADVPPPTLTEGRPYILFLGLLEPRKNLVRLVAAFDRLKERGAPHHLVLAGGQGWHSGPLLSAVRQARYRDSILLPGYLSEADKMSWLAHADVFAFPSIFEGFGIPPLEAQQWGVPVVVSRTEAFEEVYGDSVEYCRADDPDDIAMVLARVIDDASLRTRLRAAGRANAERYSWASTASRTLDAYREVVGARSR